MYLGRIQLSREEPYVDESGDEPRNRIRTIEYSKYWIEDNENTVADILAQDDPHYTSVSFYEIVEDDDKVIRLEPPVGRPSRG